MLRINDIKINNIGPITDLYLKFDDTFNIICGMNGIGKTTILDCLAQIFSLNRLTVKKKAGSALGEWVVNGLNDGNKFNHRMATSSDDPASPLTNDSNGMYKLAKNVIVFKTHRTISYQQLGSINNDTRKDPNQLWLEATNGANNADTKNWFVSRHMWSAHENHLNDIQLKNLETAKSAFGLLNSDITFSKVLPSTNDILLKTPTGEIAFEFLSSGYKSSLLILLVLIKEIEFRFSNPGLLITDFDGIIFIDELDLHLHPEWQAKIYIALKALLPKAQFFTSTHSPHIIQVAAAQEIIPLILNADNNVAFNPVINQQYGCQGWTVEEVLRDVMGMTETRTELYLDTIAAFNKAVDEENLELANQSFALLDGMLHPESSLRKILKIQLIGLESND